jgi:hypothetical protein
MNLLKVVKRNKIQRICALLAVGVLALTACRRVPGEVIAPDEMAMLLADIHVGDAVVEQNRRDYGSDSVKMLLKQSILARHGVDGERFDSSLSWYAHNPEIYLEVYDKTIEILQTRMNENDAQIAGSLSVVGDSVDLWGGARFLAVSDLSATKYVTFNIEADENSEQGDRYTWRGKFVNNISKTRWGIAATYSDGTVEVLDAEADKDGWNEIEFVSDSTLHPEKIYGYMEVQSRPGMTTWIDSIQLVRNRKNPASYRHRYSLRTYRR